MNVSNHAATGALLAIVIKEPVLALPLAFASHFVMDAVPHFGYEDVENLDQFIKEKMNGLTRFMLSLEIIGWVYLIFLLHAQPFIVLLAALTALSPDLIWLYRYLKFERKGIKPPPKSLLSRLHAKLNWQERPWLLPVEIVWFLTVTLLIRNII